MIDERGRLFGKVNLIDAIVGVIVLGVIPLVYGAFLLFRVPAPTVTGLSPDRVPAHQATMIQITGQDLRQFLDVHFGRVASSGVFVRSSTLVEVLVPDLPEGAYDLTLSSEGKVLLVKPGALKVDAAPATGVTAELQGVGAFIGLTDADARVVVKGAKFGKEAAAAAEVLAVRAPEAATARVRVGDSAFVTVPLPGLFRVAATVRLGCVLFEGGCKIGGAFVAPAASIPLALPDGSRQLTFVIDEVRPGNAPATIPPSRSAIATLRVRFVADSAVVDLMKAGDVDVPAFGVVAERDRAVLTQIGDDRQVTSGLLGTEGMLRRSVQLQRPVLTVTGTVRVPVIRTATGWSYKDRVIKIGSAFVFETAAAGMTGWILEMKVVESER
jgi:hypothetical protein